MINLEKEVLTKKVYCMVEIDVPLDYSERDVRIDVERGVKKEGWCPNVELRSRDILDFIMQYELDGVNSRQLWEDMKKANFPLDEYVRFANICVSIDMLPKWVKEKMWDQLGK